jgi:hypothetical protein
MVASTPHGAWHQRGTTRPLPSTASSSSQPPYRRVGGKPLEQRISPRLLTGWVFSPRRFCAARWRAQPPPCVQKPDDPRAFVGFLVATRHAVEAGNRAGRVRRYLELTWRADRRIVARKRIRIFYDA